MRFIGIPYGVVDPEKTDYAKGERIKINIAYWIDKQWVWFTNISAIYDSMSSLNDNRIMTYIIGRNLYFKVSEDSTTVYQTGKGRLAIYLDPEGLP